MPSPVWWPAKATRDGELTVSRVNEFNQPVGPDLAGWEPPRSPPFRELHGTSVVLEPLDRERHAGALFTAFRDAPDALWTYMTFGPFRSVDELAATIDTLVKLPGWQPYAIVVGGKPVGIMSYLRIDPANGAIEIGSIVFSPALQRTRAATEAIYLLIKNAFALGYRRCEWKCDDLNDASRVAAGRLGFRYEGTFRKATYYKGRSRDTAWYAIIDDEWPALDVGYQTWLADDNFEPDGRQRRSLDIRSALPQQ
jgi:RimJ/RimL family protein N-acetyltransferase